MLQPGDTINPSSSQTLSAEAPDDQQSWIEGHKIVVESNNGENVHVLSIPQDCSDSPASRSQGPSVAVVNDTIVVDETLLPRDAASHDQQEEHPAESVRPRSSSSRSASVHSGDPAPDDDEWEEEIDSQSVHSSTQRSRGTSSRAHSTNSARPRSTRHSLRRTQILHGKSAHSGSKLASVDDISRPEPSAARRASHHPARTIGFHNVKDHHPRSGLSAIRSGHASTRSSSPSQSIRFADHMARPNRGGPKKTKKRSKLGILKRISSSNPSSSLPPDNAEDPSAEGDKESKPEN
ncbi:uncharacterized protein MELLADRAFT_72986 [Melampsora larici-populina 98AG31]|uniref:Uncharacterized protein n=1 Tax=Melampsora larici-populina (strain 98AG31 / pathotype 3-4-7) TaxID=747676 RepID=F4S1N3_MELLP|nr:uncharacterized protein MELLADRAFT_72986 [Melampsora larici-populina 98AG31]EGG01408.1 hypothetical protein MELLADRAFT_72986 [Melampsora larici-populina 98AG31]